MVVKVDGVAEDDVWIAGIELAVLMLAMLEIPSWVCLDTDTEIVLWNEAESCVVGLEVEECPENDVWTDGCGPSALRLSTPTTAVLITVFVRTSVASGTTSTVL